MDPIPDKRSEDDRPTDNEQHNVPETSTSGPAGDCELLGRGGKLQMVPFTEALPAAAAAIVVVVENRSLNKDCVVPRSPSSASSSSIGGAGDDLENTDESEVQSPLRAGPLDRMESLESSLPLKRGLSRFFGGKSRSFTSLKEVSSAQELSKPESPFQYAKRRKLLHSSNRGVRSSSSSWSTCTVGVVGLSGGGGGGRSGKKRAAGRDWGNGISPALVSMSSVSFSLANVQRSQLQRVSSVHN